MIKENVFYEELRIRIHTTVYSETKETLTFYLEFMLPESKKWIGVRDSYHQDRYTDTSPLKSFDTREELFEFISKYEKGEVIIYSDGEFVLTKPDTFSYYTAEKKY